MTQPAPPPNDWSSWRGPASQEPKWEPQSPELLDPAYLPGINAAGDIETIAGVAEQALDDAGRAHHEGMIRCRDVGGFRGAADAGNRAADGAQVEKLVDVLNATGGRALVRTMVSEGQGALRFDRVNAPTFDLSGSGFRRSCCCSFCSAAARSSVMQRTNF
jgi:hypothetical protein